MSSADPAELRFGIVSHHRIGLLDERVGNGQAKDCAHVGQLVQVWRHASWLPNREDALGRYRQLVVSTPPTAFIAMQKGPSALEVGIGAARTLSSITQS